MNNNKIIISLLILLVVVIIAGCIIFNPLNAKTETTLTMNNNTSLYNNDTLTVKLVNNNGEPINNQIVNITVTNKDGWSNTQQVITDNNGEAKLPLNNYTKGNYTIKTIFGGSEHYKTCNITKKLEILEPIKQQSTSSTSTSNSGTYNKEGLTVDSSSGRVVSGGQYSGWSIDDVEKQPKDRV